MRIEWTDDPTALDRLAPAWDALAGEAAPPFVRAGWFRAWWRAFGSGRLALATAWEGEALAGVLPLARTGSTLRALANDHTPVFRAVGSQAACAELFDEAVRASSILTAPALTAGDPSATAMLRAARTRRRLVLTQDYQRHAVVRTDGPWDAYLASLDRKFRRDLQRRARRAAEELGLQQIVLAPPAGERELELGFAAESAGWKGERGSSILAEPGAAAFYRELAAWLAPEGALRISALVDGDRYAAFDLSVIGGNRVWILKGGFDEEYRRFAPGLVLTLAQIEAAHAAGHDAVELLGQTVPWKLRFASDARRQVYAGAYRRGAVPLVHWAARRARPAARAAYRRLPWVSVR